MIDRYEIERKLARVLSRDLRVELDKLLNYLGDPPNLANVPPAYWNDGWRDIQKALCLNQADHLKSQLTYRPLLTAPDSIPALICAQLL